MKFLVILAVFLCGSITGYNYAQARTKSDAPPDEAKVSLTMYSADGTNRTREYQGIVSWVYNVVNGQGHMQLGFVNPTLYRCGFEP